MVNSMVSKPLDNTSSPLVHPYICPCPTSPQVYSYNITTLRGQLDDESVVVEYTITLRLTLCPITHPHNIHPIHTLNTSLHHPLQHIHPIHPHNTSLHHPLHHISLDWLITDEQDNNNDVSASAENKDGSSSVSSGPNRGPGTPSCIVLDNRISRCMLLRRICEVCGVRVASRDYHFPPSAGNNASTLTFEAKDIWGCIPLMKSCEQSVPLTECRALLANAKTYMERGHVSLAFDMLSETSQYQQQITGPVHKEYLMITSVMTKLLVDAGDAQAALAQCAKSLSLSVQLFGLDSPDAGTHPFDPYTLSTHVTTLFNKCIVLTHTATYPTLSGLFHQQMASILAEMLDRPGVAIQHLLAARYIAELTGGPNHPGLNTTHPLTSPRTRSINAS